MAETEVTFSKGRFALGIVFIVLWSIGGYFMVEAGWGIPIVVLVVFFGLIASFCSVCWWNERQNKKADLAENGGTA